MVLRRMPGKYSDGRDGVLRFPVQWRYWKVKLRKLLVQMLGAWIAGNCIGSYYSQKRVKAIRQTA